MRPSFLLGAAPAAAALLQPRNDSSGIQWGPCDLDTELPVQCAQLAVPLDYTDESSNRTLNLDLIKYPAQKQPSKGSILLNFGGPGQDGLLSMLDYAEVMAPVTGGQHDLVSFDPRGTGKTLRFSCFGEDDILGESALYYALSTLPHSSDTATGRLWAAASVISDSCYKQLKETGELVGMAFVARDMIQIVDALEEDGLLRYWGISGGTILGATVAAMFPERVDKVLLDGVVNSHEYYHKLGEPEMFAATDKVVDGFLAACLATPQNCALARANRTVQDLKLTIDGLLQEVKYNPVQHNGTIVDYSYLNNAFLSFLYVPALYPALAAAFDRLLSQDVAGFLDIVEMRSVPMQDQAILGIRCGDKLPKTDSLAGLQPVFAEFEQTTRWFPDLAWATNVMACAQWHFRAKEVYDGDFNVKTRNPVFFTGSHLDPVTPWLSAKNMSESFQNAVALHHKGFGHLSISQSSNCTNTAIEKYFLEGVVPEHGTVCEPDEPIFSTKFEMH